ncbi:type VI secretion system baseplate subunit TssG [Paracoccus sp. (in: a-proteobacteria)]|uniref:type VI secretion system baseplate subunit TssG n=1 Tax=Paracoccus sp. TaxID=267 RepID=UPI00321FDF2D
MADAPRTSPPDLTGLPAGIEAFELMRRHETRERRFGHAGSPAQEPARLGQELRLGPAACEVALWRPASDGRPARIALETIGLFGPEGPMPLHISRRIHDRLSERWFAGDPLSEPGADRAFLEFANLLQHRMMALFYRAHAEAQPAIAADHGGRGRLAAMLAALAECGLPGVPVEDLLLRHATDLASQIRNPERIAALVSDLLGAPVRLREFAPYWQAMPVHLASRLGRAHAGLGRGAMLGPRVYQPQARAELVVGPLDLPRYRALMVPGPARDALRRLLRLVMGEEIGFDLRLVLAASEVPPPILGAGMELGRCGWLGGAARERSDLCQPIDERQAA